MTIWDNIYKNFKKTGEIWATLSKEIIPEFVQFVQDNTFSIKHVLDIGCGTGDYLLYLEKNNFITDGIDSSETAVAMTKEILKSDSKIICADMYNFAIPEDCYDLIISIAAIHHGKKNQVRGLVDKIYSALVPDGKIFITLPDYDSANKWETFKKHSDLGGGTYAPLSGPEMGLPHSFYTREEAESIFSKFNDLKIILDKKGRWVITGTK